MNLVVSSYETPVFWKYVDETAEVSHHINGDFPMALIKNIKRLFYENGLEYFLDNNTEIRPFHDFVLTPNAKKAFKHYFLNRPINEITNCPSNEEIANILLENDKLFNMVTLIWRNEVGSMLIENFKQGEYKHASLVIAGLINKYNLEIIKYLNLYFSQHVQFDNSERDEGFKNISRSFIYHLTFSRSYAISNEPYIAALIYRIHLFPDIEDEENKELVNKIYELAYENYNVCVVPDNNHRIKATGSFLSDCKAISRLKKEVFFEPFSFLEFHDLMKYGPYSDKILSIEVVSKLSEIFGHTSWIHPFVLSLALLCDKFITIDDCMEKAESCGAVIDPNKIQNFDLCVKAIQYLDSIYDSLIIKENDK